MAKDYKELGKRIQELREKNFNGSLRDFAKAIGASPTFVCRLEQGETRPGPELLKKISDFLHAIGDELFILADSISPDLEKIVKEEDVSVLLRTWKDLPKDKRDEMLKTIKKGLK